jgi:hypothetical protein
MLLVAAKVSYLVSTLPLLLFSSYPSSEPISLVDHGPTYSPDIPGAMFLSFCEIAIIL